MANQQDKRARQLIELRRDHQLFQDQTGVSYAYVEFEDGRRRIMQLGGKDYRNLLFTWSMDRHGWIPSRNTLTAVLAQLDLKATSSEPVRLENRFARDASGIWLDLADEKRRAIKISADGWKVVLPRRVLFKPYAHQLPLPTPHKGGDALRLFGFLNMPGDDEKLLTLTWLCAALIPDIPRPILCLLGTQGSAKSTQAKFLRSLIDPSIMDTMR